MILFVDSGDVESIEFWIRTGIGAGVTTNPIIMKASGAEDIDAQLRRIVEIAGDRPVSIQVSSTDPKTVYAEAERFAGLGDNVVIKVPVISADGVSSMTMIHDLARRGYKINATACLSAMQAIMAAMAGARYVSLFAGRISDQGGDSTAHIRSVRTWLDQSGLDTGLIVGSIRTVAMVAEALEAGPHICTVKPAILAKCADHAMSRRTAADFEASAAELRAR